MYLFHQCCCGFKIYTLQINGEGFLGGGIACWPTKVHSTNFIPLSRVNESGMGHLCSFDGWPCCPKMKCFYPLAEIFVVWVIVLRCNWLYT